MPNGAATLTMATPGSETPTFLLPTGSVHLHTWPSTARHGQHCAMSLRNESRTPPRSFSAFASYGWASWLENMVEAADGVNKANEDTLILYSGLNYDLGLRNVTQMLCSTSSFPYANKIVFELHNYNNNLENRNCAEFTMYKQGANAMDTSPISTAKNMAPVLLTDAHDDTTYLMPYAQCIKVYMSRVRGGWMKWVVSGSFYVRQGIQYYDETWALLNHDWSDYRSHVVVDQYWKPFDQATLWN
ncbi:hypothetical protein TI39_contig4215g00009 [Zymoseptoria brevis]|uniref:Glycoside hydrolase family 5 domain-containing protein n=1 Tax=Zymoseptoria brevis TaxID=1047168 RepID=A0A0F4G9W6_9PEZI|nr:hypothetical protein TI39_contig4215g00009 [Zymoseptoria brevis]